MARQLSINALDGGTLVFAPAPRWLTHQPTNGNAHGWQNDAGRSEHIKPRYQTKRSSYRAMKTTKIIRQLIKELKPLYQYGLRAI
jgi:hypothetical protein